MSDCNKISRKGYLVGGGAISFASFSASAGVIVKPCAAPALTLTAPLGAMPPFAPALAVIVYVSIAKLAEREDEDPSPTVS